MAGDVSLRTTLLLSLASGFISLLVAYFTTAYKFSRDRRLLQDELSQRSLEKLYSIRLECYPRAFEITERIRRTTREQGGINSRDELLKFHNDLWTWKSGQVSLALSRSSIDAFYELVKRLNKPCEDSRNAIYSTAQIDKIMTARNTFRSSLRQDVGIKEVEKWRMT